MQSPISCPSEPMALSSTAARSISTRSVVDEVPDVGLAGRLREQLGNILPDSAPDAPDHVFARHPRAWALGDERFDHPARGRIEPVA